MELQIYILIFSFVGILAMLVLRKYAVIGDVRYALDDKIESISLAVIRNIVRIWKLIFGYISDILVKLFKLLNFLWIKLRKYIDRGFDRLGK